MLAEKGRIPLGAESSRALLLLLERVNRISPLARARTKPVSLASRQTTDAKVQKFAHHSHRALRVEIIPCCRPVNKWLLIARSSHPPIGF
jgi:hypothetical protein